MIFQWRKSCIELQLAYFIDIFEDNQKILRDGFATNSVNVIKNEQTTFCKETKFQYVSTWLSHIRKLQKLSLERTKLRTLKSFWFARNYLEAQQAGQYSVQSGKLSNVCFLAGYQTLIAQKTFFALESSLEIHQGDSLRHYLRSPKIEAWQFSNLVIPNNSSFKFDHFLQKNLILIINRCQDIRVQIFWKSQGNVIKLYFPKLQQVPLEYFFFFYWVEQIK